MRVTVADAFAALASRYCSCAHLFVGVGELIFG